MLQVALTSLLLLEGFADSEILAEVAVSSTVMHFINNFCLL